MQKLAGGKVASVLGQKLGSNAPTRVKMLLPVGVSAALAAAFNTPIAAVLFTLEEIMGDMNAPVLGSIVLSSATSWIVMHLVLGDEPLFHVPSYQLVHPAEFLIYALLGIAGGVVSVAFVRLLLWQRARFMSLPEWTQSYLPVVGGLTVGVMGWFVPEVLGVGYAHVGEALNGQMALRLMILLVGLKLVATATCYSSGGTGGIFGPSLFLGAMLGGALGSGVHSLFPEYTGSAGAYALVGMGTTFAGIIRVPMTSVIMIFELTRDYSIIVPVMISNLVAYAISSKLQPVPIYEALQHQEGLHLPSGHSKERALLVEDAVRPDRKSFPASMTVVEALAKLEAGADSWPVIRLDGAYDDELLGLVTVRELREAVESGHSDHKLSEVLQGTDSEDSMALRHITHVHMDHTLDTAQRRMASGRTNVLPVINRANIRRIIGVLLIEDIQRAYGIEGQQAKGRAAEQGSVTAGMILLRMVAITLVVLILLGLVTRTYQNGRTKRAAAAYQAGIALVTQGNTDEAIERFRAALSTTPDNKDYRLALGSALVQGEHLEEASLYLSGILKSDPDNGPANLEMARVAIKNGTIAGAVSNYHKADLRCLAEGRGTGAPGGGAGTVRLFVCPRPASRSGSRTSGPSQFPSYFLSHEGTRGEQDSVLS